MISFIPLFSLVFMAGGQINKIIRPIGIPFICLLMAFLAPHGHWYDAIPSFGYGIVLSLGYGPNSLLYRWLGDEQRVRIVYGNLLALPVALTIALTMHWWAYLSWPLIVASCCIRLGSWGKIGRYDILPVDIFRGLAVGIGMYFTLN